MGSSGSWRLVLILTIINLSFYVCGISIDSSSNATEKRHLLIPIFEIICPCLPSSVRQRLHCGVDHDSFMNSDDDLTCCFTCNDCTCNQVSRQSISQSINQSICQHIDDKKYNERNVRSANWTPSGELRGKGRWGVFAGNTVWSTSERLRGEVLTTRRYTNLLLPYLYQGRRNLL